MICCREPAAEEIAVTMVTGGGRGVWRWVVAARPRSGLPRLTQRPGRAERRQGLLHAGWNSAKQNGGWARAAGRVGGRQAGSPARVDAAAAAAMDALEEESFALSS